jgi:hypothetical protein
LTVIWLGVVAAVPPVEQLRDSVVDLKPLESGFARTCTEQLEPAARIGSVQEFELISKSVGLVSEGAAQPEAASFPEF